MARPRKPVEILKATGQFRSDRHGKRAAAPVPLGQPEKPSQLKGEAAKEWDRIYPELARLNLVGAIDRSLLAAVCRMYANYDRAQKDFDRMPSSKDIRISALQCYQAYVVGVRELGLSPAARSKLDFDKPVPESAGGAGPVDFARKRG